MLLSTLLRCFRGSVNFIYAFEAWPLLTAGNFDSMVSECHNKGSVMKIHQGAMRVTGDPAITLLPNPGKASCDDIENMGHFLNKDQ